MITKNKKSNGSNREIILNVARELISEKGVKQTSLADVAREAEISKGTLFYHFPSKSLLIYEIVERHFEELTESMISRLSQLEKDYDPVEKLQMVMQTLLYEDNLGRMNLYLIQEAMLEDLELRSRFVDQYESWRQLITQQLVRVFDLEGLTGIKSLAAVILAVIDGLTIQWLLDSRNIDLYSVSHHLASMIPISCKTQETSVVKD